MPAAFNSRFFCRNANLLASSNCRSLAFLFAFFPCVLASLALASLSISFSADQRGVCRRYSLHRVSSRMEWCKVPAQPTVIVHIDRVGSRGPRLWIRIDLARFETPHIDRRLRLDIVSRTQPQIVIIFHLRIVEELLVSLQTLSGGPADDGRYRPPLRRHEFSEVQQLLIFRLDVSAAPSGSPLRITSAEGRQTRGGRLTLDHSIFLMDGSSHSYHLALHCFGVFRTNKLDIRAHCYGVSREVRHP